MTISVTVTNHHCDSRSVRVPGMKNAVKLPACIPIQIKIGNEKDLHELHEILFKSAPAATVEIVSKVSVTANAEAIDPKEQSGVDSDKADGCNPDTVSIAQLPETVPVRRKRRSRK